MSKISDAISKVTGKADPEREVSDALYSKIEEAKSAFASLQKQIEKKNAALIDLDRTVNALSLAASLDDSKMPAALKAQQTLDDANAEIAVLRRGLNGAREAITAAEVAFNAAGKAKRISEIKRKNGERDRHAAKIEDLLAELSKEWREYFVATGRLVANLPGDIANAGGAMTRTKEIETAFSQELRRQNPIEATMANQPQPFPEQDTRSIISTKNIISFAELTRRAGEHILRLYEKANSPAPNAKAEKTALPAPAPVLSVTGEIIPDAPQGINAAAMPPRKEELFVTNTNVEE